MTLIDECCCTDHQRAQIQPMRRLVVVRCPPLRNGGGTVSFQRLRRGRALLVHLQRTGLLSALPGQRDESHSGSAAGERSAETARHARLFGRRNL